MKLSSIQGLRAIAILLVIGSHTRGFENPLHLQSPFVRFIPAEVTGVDLFFVISGFVMMYVHWNDFQAGASLKFLLKRVLRIFPMYWLFTAVLAAFFLAFPQAIHRWESAHTNLVLSFLLLPQVDSPLLYVGWTLVFEMYFYYVFALGLLFKRNVATALLAAWGGVLAVFQFFPAQQGVLLGFTTQNLPIEFLFGIAVAYLCRSGVRRFAPQALVLGVGLYIAAVANGLQHAEHWLMSSNFRFLMVGLPMALVAYACVTFEAQGRLTVPKWLQYIGDASYSIYLTHIITYSVLSHALLPIAARVALPKTLTPIGFYAAAVLCGLGVYRFIEKPTIARLNAWYYRAFPKKNAKIPVVSGMVQASVTERV